MHIFFLACVWIQFASFCDFRVYWLVSSATFTCCSVEGGLIFLGSRVEQGYFLRGGLSPGGEGSDSTR